MVIVQKKGEGTLMIYEVKNLKYAYPGQKNVLNGMSLSLEEGELLCVLGRNGAGKSTFFSCLLGLLKPYDGSILLEGKEVRNLKEKNVATIVGYVPQNNNSTFEFSVLDYVLMGCASSIGIFQRPGKNEEDAAWNALCMMGLNSFAYRTFSELSGGERQQVAIARAIASNPKVILFDEPTAHLDYSNQIKVLKIIKNLSEKGFAVAVTTHDPNHAMLLNGSVALFDGKGGLEYGKVSELITEEKLQSIYGSDLKIRYMEEFKRNVCVYPSL